MSPTPHDGAPMPVATPPDALSRFDRSSPVRSVDADDERGPTVGNALCLSGGGYRAMLFHLGALWRLNELGWLRKLNRISSVSGGSIMAGALALAWPRLDFGDDDIARGFGASVVDRVRALARRTIDVKSVIRGILWRGTIAERVAKAYDEYLFEGRTLQDLPDERPGVAPRFVFNASNVQSGVLFRFSKPYARDWRVGKIERPTLPLSLAVAASSAFPPPLSPLVLKLQETDYTPGTGRDLQRPPFTTRPMLTDGGVYDNLGLETAWKRYRTIFVSDGGGQMAASAEPHRDWARHSKRILDLIDNQVRSLRKRQVLDAFGLPRDDGPAWRNGSYWGIRTNIRDYGLPDSLPCPHEKTLALAAEPTRLAKIDVRRQERIINWGYAVCDAAMRRWVLTGEVVRAPRFPYESAGLG